MLPMLFGPSDGPPLGEGGIARGGGGGVQGSGGGGVPEYAIHQTLDSGRKPLAMTGSRAMGVQAMANHGHGLTILEVLGAVEGPDQGKFACV